MKMSEEGIKVSRSRDEAFLAIKWEDWVQRLKEKRWELEEELEEELDAVCIRGEQ